jgi:hypothetical protein
MIDLPSKNMDLLGYMRYSRDTSKEWWILRLLGHHMDNTWKLSYTGSILAYSNLLDGLVFPISRLVKTEVWQCGSQ